MPYMFQKMMKIQLQVIEFRIEINSAIARTTTLPNRDII